MTPSLSRFCFGVCILAVALMLHRFSEDAATSQARLEGYQLGFRAWQNTQPDLSSACQMSPPHSNPTLDTILGTKG
jgi:hypothetical protein